MRAIPAKASDVTALLHAWRAGDHDALPRLVPLVQDELRKIARGCIRGEHPAPSLQATALVNEAYVRLAGAQRVNWQSRLHFLAMSARVMRRVLVDAARARRAAKRGGHLVSVSLSGAADKCEDIGADVVALHDALLDLEAIDPRTARVVELRFFAGLSGREIAAALDVSSKTVAREWSFAKAWLRGRLVS